MICLFSEILIGKDSGMHSLGREALYVSRSLSIVAMRLFIFLYIRKTGAIGCPAWKCIFIGSGYLSNTRFFENNA